MKIKKTVLGEMIAPYAIELFEARGKRTVFAASEQSGGFMSCPGTGGEATFFLERCGGVMTIHQLNENPDFLAIVGFYKGMKGDHAGIQRAVRQRDGTYTLEDYIDMPFIHRFCVVEVQATEFLLACTIAAHKTDRDDWSKPGAVYVAELSDNPARRVPVPILEGIYKNHGLFSGMKDGRRVVLVSGREGLFQINVPDHPTDAWHCEKLIDGEISDVVVCDVDGDGIDEICTIETFHGDTFAVYKMGADGYKKVYTYHAPFGHALWAGDVFGKPTVVLGYRAENGALLLLQKSSGSSFDMDVVVIDEHESPNNIQARQDEGVFRIYSTCGATQTVCMYELTE